MSHNSSSSDHQNSKNLRTLQAVASAILWKLCITIMPTQDIAVKQLALHIVTWYTSRGVGKEQA